MWQDGLDSIITQAPEASLLSKIKLVNQWLKTVRTYTGNFKIITRNKIGQHLTFFNFYHLLLFKRVYHHRLLFPWWRFSDCFAATIRGYWRYTWAINFIHGVSWSFGNRVSHGLTSWLLGQWSLNWLQNAFWMSQGWFLYLLWFRLFTCPETSCTCLVKDETLARLLWLLCYYQMSIKINYKNSNMNPQS